MNIKPYISLSARIRAKVAGVKDIDIYNNQYENGRNNDVFNTPAVFIEYAGGDWQDMTQGIQILDGGFIVHVVQSNYTHTKNIDKKTQPQQEDALKHYGIDGLVHKALKQWMPDGCSSNMVRKGTFYDHNHDQLIITKHVYECLIDDDSNETEYIEVDVDTVSVKDGIVEQA